MGTHHSTLIEEDNCTLSKRLEILQIIKISVYA